MFGLKREICRSLSTSPKPLRRDSTEGHTGDSTEGNTGDSTEGQVTLFGGREE